MTEIPAGAVTVADLYRELTGLRTDLQAAHMTLRVIEERDQGTRTTLTDHETRIRLLERFRWTIAGLATAGGVIAGYVGYLVGGHVGHP